MMFYWAQLQLISYSVLSWLLFISVAFLSARIGRSLGVLVGHVLVAMIVAWLDVQWIQAEMSKPHPDGGPDMDIIFSSGVALRILWINTVLLPISILGLWSSHRHRNLRVDQTPPSKRWVDDAKRG